MRSFTDPTKQAAFSFAVFCTIMFTESIKIILIEFEHTFYSKKELSHDPQIFSTIF